jgi:hypothetical protein
MTGPRPWPNNAKHARDRAAEELAAARRDLSFALQNVFNVDRSELIRRLGVALDHCDTALRHLESVGAETRPE